MQPSRWHHAAHLMRLHAPTGIWLLFWPCAWSLTLASQGEMEPKLLLIFFAGSITMRAAGCIINDLTDRSIDAQVARTRVRPLASGAISVRAALSWLMLLLSISALIALTLGPSIVALAALWLIPVTLYPWMKRITWWPQMFLGLTFNAGALFGWLAVTDDVPIAAWYLYAASILWTLGYDTLYAHQDIEDDARIGVKSTARLFGKWIRVAVGICYSSCVCFLAASGYESGASLTFFAYLIPVALHLGWQVVRVRFNNAEDCCRMFHANIWTGLLIFIATLAA
ncbi:MAG: 4-hydroxybenzoate octaprenyltransferase [Rickettsiales bacterium]|nr:4-hydroxybenzoate octaprenyltransferase [Rickettsiales bacterium]